MVSHSLQTDYSPWRVIRGNYWFEECQDFFSAGHMESPHHVDWATWRKPSILGTPIIPYLSIWWPYQRHLMSFRYYITNAGTVWYNWAMDASMSRFITIPVGHARHLSNGPPLGFDRSFEIINWAVSVRLANLRSVIDDSHLYNNATMMLLWYDGIIITSLRRSAERWPECGHPLLTLPTSALWKFISPPFDQ